MMFIAPEPEDRARHYRAQPQKLLGCTWSFISFIQIYCRGERRLIHRPGILTNLNSGRTIYIRIFAAPQFMRRVLLVGGGKAGRFLLKSDQRSWPPPFSLPGSSTMILKNWTLRWRGIRFLAPARVLLPSSRQNISDIIVAITGQM